MALFYKCFCIILFETTMFIYCSLISRLKNPYHYKSTSDVVILPEDYNVLDERKGLKLLETYSSADADIQAALTKTSDSIENIEEASKFVYSYRPTKAMTFHQNILNYIDEDYRDVWPTITFKTMPATEHITVFQNSSPLMIWKPYIFTNTKAINVTDKQVSRYIIRNFSNLVTSYPKSDSVTTVLPKALISNTTKTKGQRKYNSSFMLRFIFKDSNNTGTLLNKGRLLKRTRKPKSPQDNVIRARCYTCGMNNISIFGNRNCFNVFSSPEHRYRYARKRMKDKCRGNQFIGGCFKRYLDIGEQYCERGCRAMPPLKGGTYASTRYRKLELVLKGVSEGCVASPAASLIPFSRAISLYAYFHVCVCKRDYCNTAPLSLSANMIQLLAFYVILFIIKYVGF